MPVVPGPRDPTRVSPNPQAPQSRLRLQPAVGIPIAATDVLPVGKRSARGHQGLVEIAAPAEQFGHRAAVAVGGLDAELQR